MTVAQREKLSLYFSKLDWLLLVGCCWLLCCGTGKGLCFYTLTLVLDLWEGYEWGIGYLWAVTALKPHETVMHVDYE